MRKSGGVSLAAAILLATTLHADSVTLGSATASGSTVVLPLYVRDASGTPLGSDAGPGNRIQSLSFRVTFSPAAAVTSASFSRSGITQSLSPLFESAPSTSGSASFIASFQESSSPIPFTLNAGGPGDEVAKLTISLSGSAAPGSTIAVTFDPSTTQLSNQNGTVSETPPSLSLADGTVTIPGLTATLLPADQQVGVGENAVLTVTLSANAPAAGDVAVAAAPPGVLTVPASVPIAAGSRTATINASTSAEGTATVTATLPAAFGGGTVSATVRVVRVSAPEAPANVTPADGASGVTSPVVLRWSGGAGATRYDVYFGTATDPPLFTTTVAGEQLVTTAPGTTYYWRITAVNPAGGTPGPITSFTTAGSTNNCPIPAVPVLVAPAEATSGQSYTIQWAAVANATEYRLEESTEATFATKTSTTVTSTQASFTKSATNSRFYYRVLARNGASGCDQSSAFSTVASVLVKPATTSPMRVIVVAGSTAGSFGSFFRTAAQLHNNGTAPISGHIVFHPQGASGSSSDPRVNYTLGPRETLTYADIFSALGVSGLGSMDLVSDFGALPRVVIRIYNDAGDKGTAGMTLPLIRPEDALTAGRTGLLIAPPDATRARFNLGFRTLGGETTFTLRLLNSTGSSVKSVSMTLEPNYFIQRTAADVMGMPIGNSDVIEIAVEKGALIAYGSTTDNITQDASIQVEVPTP